MSRLFININIDVHKKIIVYHVDIIIHNIIIGLRKYLIQIFILLHTRVPNK